MHGRPLGDGDLGGDVGRAAEAVDAEPAARWHRGPAQRTEPDDPGAQERCHMLVVEAVGEPVGVALVDNRVVGIATVRVPAGETGVEAQVLVTSEAEPAGATGPPQPRDADALARCEPRRARAEPVDDAHDLVTGDHLRPMRWQVALGEMQVGAAHAADRHADPQLTRGRFRSGPLDERQRPLVDRARLLHDPRLHVAVNPAPATDPPTG